MGWKLGWMYIFLLKKWPLLGFFNVTFFKGVIPPFCVVSFLRHKASWKTWVPLITRVIGLLWWRLGSRCYCLLVRERSPPLSRYSGLWWVGAASGKRKLKVWVENRKKWFGDSHECLILMLTRIPRCCFFSSVWMLLSKETTAWVVVHTTSPDTVVQFNWRTTSSSRPVVWRLYYVPSLKLTAKAHENPYLSL